MTWTSALQILAIPGLPMIEAGDDLATLIRNRFRSACAVHQPRRDKSRVESHGLALRSRILDHVQRRRLRACQDRQACVRLTAVMRLVIEQVQQVRPQL